MRRRTFDPDIESGHVDHLDRWLDEIADLDQVTYAHYDWIGQVISEYHLVSIDGGTGSGDILDRTNVVEDVVMKLIDEEPHEGWINCARRVLRGTQSPESAEAYLPRIEICDFPDYDDELESSMRTFMEDISLIPEFQERVDDRTVYCGNCDREYDSAPSTLSVHNMRRHEYHPDIYDYDEGRTCRDCGEETSFEPTESEKGVDLKTCTECGVLQ